MTTFLRLLLGLCLTTGLVAQDAAPDPVPQRSQAELDKLVAPIALYPDALVALILPAATSTADVVLAARFLDSDGKETEIDQQAWDDSVKSLARYPDLIRWMDDNLEWTRELGEAFLAQPADVMNTVQALREKARAAGLLKDTPEQRVVVREEKILIIPARSHYLHIPAYDPEILYVQEYYNPRPFLTFSAGFAVGSWLNYDCDWHRHTVWKHRRPHGWVYRPDWRWHHAGRRPLDSDEWRPHPQVWRRHRERQAHYHARPVPHVRHPRFGHDDRRDRPGLHSQGRRDGVRRPDDGRHRLGPRDPNPNPMGGPGGERRYVRGTTHPFDRSRGSLAPASQAPGAAPAPEAGTQRYLDKRLQQRHRDRLERPMPAAGPENGLSRAAPSVTPGSRTSPGVTRSEPAIRSGAPTNRAGRNGEGRFDRGPRTGASAPAASVARPVEASPAPATRVQAPPPRVESAAPVRESQPAIRANQIRGNGGGGSDRGGRFSRGSREG